MHTWEAPIDDFGTQPLVLLTWMWTLQHHGQSLTDIRQLLISPKEPQLSSGPPHTKPAGSCTSMSWPKHVSMQLKHKPALHVEQLLQAKIVHSYQPEGHFRLVHQPPPHVIKQGQILSNRTVPPGTALLLLPAGVAAQLKTGQVSQNIAGNLMDRWAFLLLPPVKDSHQAIADHSM